MTEPVSTHLTQNIFVMPREQTHLPAILQNDAW